MILTNAVLLFLCGSKTASKHKNQYSNIAKLLFRTTLANSNYHYYPTKILETQLSCPSFKVLFIMLVEEHFLRNFAIFHLELSCKFQLSHTPLFFASGTARFPPAEFQSGEAASAKVCPFRRRLMRSRMKVFCCQILQNFPSTPNFFSPVFCLVSGKCHKV